MIGAAKVKPLAFDVILVHSFSRFFRDQFQLEFYVRRLAKHGVQPVSITRRGSQGRVFNTGDEAEHWTSFGQPRFPKAVNQQLRV